MVTFARVGAVAVVSAGTGCALTYSYFRPSVDRNRPCPTERHRHDTFDTKAPKWDSDVRFDEFVAGIGRMRRRLMQHATGDVLEVAVGTGRNFSYYNSAKVKSLTAADFSRGMLEVADSKRSELSPIPLRLKVTSTHRLDFEACSFDTVVDTFGICSFESPVEALRELRRVVRDDGQVLLLEHGASNWEFMQGLLNSGAKYHAEKFGCYPNRNITGLVEEAGLHIEKNERKHFGTTYLLICRKNPPEPEPEE